MQQGARVASHLAEGAAEVAVLDAVGLDHVEGVGFGFGVVAADDGADAEGPQRAVQREVVHVPGREGANP